MASLKNKLATRDDKTGALNLASTTFNFPISSFLSVEKKILSPGRLGINKKSFEVEEYGKFKFSIPPISIVLSDSGTRNKSYPPIEL